MSRHQIKSLLELSVSNPGKKQDSKLANQVPAVDFAIETFGNARTLFNPNTFGLGKYTELQFTDRGRLRDKHTRLLFRAETELRPCLLVNATSTYSSTWSQVHHRRRDSIYICRKGCNIDTSANAALLIQTASEMMTHRFENSLSKQSASQSDTLPKYVNSSLLSFILATSNSQSSVLATSVLRSCETQISLLL